MTTSNAARSRSVASLPRGINALASALPVEFKDVKAIKAEIAKMEPERLPPAEALDRPRALAPRIRAVISSLCLAVVCSVQLGIVFLEIEG